MQYLLQEHGGTSLIGVGVYDGPAQGRRLAPSQEPRLLLLQVLLVLVMLVLVLLLVLYCAGAGTILVLLVL